MVLAVHIPVNDYRAAIHMYSQLLSLLELARQKPEDRFIFFTDQPLFKQADIPSNLEIKPVKPALKNRLLQHYWYQFKLPKLLERENATAFLSLQPVAAGSKHIPQFLWLTDLEDLLHKNGRNFKRSKDCLSQFSTIIVPGQHCAVALENKFSLGSRLRQIPVPVREVHDTKHHITDGSFFAYPLSPDTLKHLKTAMKAFTLFKKRQRSEMRFLLLGKEAEITEAKKIVEGYKLLKYVMMEQVNEDMNLLRWLGVSYANVFLSERFSMTEEAELLLRSGKPLVCSDNIFWQDVFRDAAVYGAITEEMISIQMMNLYKNEDQKLAREQYLSEINQHCLPSATAVALDGILSLTPLHSS
jgi:hypothetical protein